MVRLHRSVFADLPDHEACTEQDQTAHEEEKGGVEQAFEGLGIDIKGLQHESGDPADPQQAAAMPVTDQDEGGKEREKKREVIRKKLEAKKKQKLADWTLQRLQGFAKVRNISISGTKARLKARIKMYLINKRKKKS